jgi:pimeloyl-ACP methyl ester carboxylesterase
MAATIPETRYTKSGDVHIAYQVLGDGPPDLVFVSGFTSHCEHQWEEPTLAQSLRKLASFSRLILMDKRGTGLSDPMSPDQLSLELRMRDMNAVLDAVGSTRAALLGASDGGPMCTLYAATYPDRVPHLVLYAAWARFLQDVDYPFGLPPDAFEAIAAVATAGWGKADVLTVVAPSVANDPGMREWWGRWERLSCSPGTMAAIVRVTFETDVRSVLASVRAPTLVIHRTGDQFASVGHGRYLAEHIPGARLAELPGIDHPHFIGDCNAVVNEVEEFITGTRSAPESTGCWRRCCSPTSSAPPSRRLTAATATGWSCSTTTTPWSGGSSSGLEAGRSRPSATASSRPSTARHARSCARRRSLRGSVALAW